MSDTQQHAFERSGCGKAPFRFIAIEERRGPLLISTAGGVEHWAGSPGQPMGVCAHCGTSIAECCIIRDAAGKTFIVGNQCVRKTGDAGLIKTSNDALNKLRRAARLEKDKKAIDEAREAMKDDGLRTKLNGMPHPYQVRADRGETFLDYACYMLKGDDYFFRTVKAKIAGQVLKVSRAVAP